MYMEIQIERYILTACVICRSLRDQSSRGLGAVDVSAGVCVCVCRSSEDQGDECTRGGRGTESIPPPPLSLFIRFPSDAVNDRYLPGGTLLMNEVCL